MEFESIISNILKVSTIDFKPTISKTKNDLDKMYDKIGIGDRFNSSAFSVYEKDGKTYVDLPIMSGIRSGGFSKKLVDNSWKIILKNLKTIGINARKKDFTFEGPMKGYFSGSTYSLSK